MYIEEMISSMNHCFIFTCTYLFRLYSAILMLKKDTAKPGMQGQFRRLSSSASIACLAVFCFVDWNTFGKCSQHDESHYGFLQKLQALFHLCR